MIKLLIFDLDGTLVNAYPAIIKSVNFTLNKLGFPSQKPLVIKRAVGMGDRHLVEGFVGKVLSVKATKIYRSHHITAVKDGVRFLPGARNLLTWAKKRGLKLAIATNRPTMFTTEILKGLKSETFFDMVLCADQAPKPKPHPAMLQMICRKLKVEKNETMFVGDMIIDLKCGAKAGIKTIAVTTGSNEKNELKELKPYKIINRIDQLKQYINKGLL